MRTSQFKLRSIKLIQLVRNNLLLLSRKDHLHIFCFGQIAQQVLRRLFRIKILFNVLSSMSARGYIIGLPFHHLLCKVHLRARSFIHDLFYVSGRFFKGPFHATRGTHQARFWLLVRVYEVGRFTFEIALAAFLDFTTQVAISK